MRINNPRTSQFPNLQSYRTTDKIDIIGPRMVQVHGDRVVVVDDPLQEIGEADGMVIKLSDVLLWTRTADCGNIYFYDPIDGVVGICHSGWRGTALNILQKTINTMISLGSHAKYIHVYIGPAICTQCHHFTKQTAGLFDDKYYEEVRCFDSAIAPLNMTQPRLLNLRSIWRDQLGDAGIIQDHIIISKQCTSCDPNLPSYKRDGTGGRIVGVMGMS